MKTLNISFEELPPEGKIALYGTGKRGQDYWKIISVCRPDINIVCFLDSFKEDIDATPPLIKTENFSSICHGVDVILICSTYFTEICCILDSYGLLYNDKILVFFASWFDEKLTATEISIYEALFNELQLKLPNESFVYEGLGLIALQKNDYDHALKHFNRVKSEFPDDVAGYLRCVDVLLRKNMYSDVESLCKIMEDKFPGNISGYLWRAYALKNMHKYADVEALCLIMEGKFSGNIESYVLHVEVLMCTNRYAEAESLSKSVTERFSTSISAYLQYVDILMRRNKLTEAKIICKHLEDKFSSNINGYLKHIHVLLTMEQDGEAEAVCKVLNEKFSDTIGACLGKIDVLIHQNRHIEAENLCKNLEIKFPDDIVGYQKHLCVFFKTKNYDAMKSLSTYLMEKFPYNLEGYLAYLECLEKLQQLPEAICLCESIRNKFPDNINVLIKHIEILIQTQQLEEAKFLCKYAEERFPDEIGGYLKYAEILIILRKLEEAEALCKKIEIKFPYDIDIFLCHIEILTHMKKYDEAETLCEILKSNFPYNITGYYRHAYILHSLEKFKEEKDVLHAARERFSTSEELLEKLKCVYVALGEFSLANTMRLAQQKFVVFESKKNHLTPKKLLVVSIPKCGGTSLNEYLMLNYCKSKIFIVYPPYEQMVSYFLSMEQAERDEYGLIAGHEAQKLIPFVGSDVLKVTLLRNPIERTISGYYYLLRIPFGTEDMTKCNLYDFVSSAENSYIYHFSTPEERQRLSGHALVMQCYSNIKKTYALVGITEKYDLFISKLQQMANLRRIYRRKVANATYRRKKLIEIDRHIIEAAKNQLALDIQLYNLVASSWNE